MSEEEYPQVVFSEKNNRAQELSRRSAQNNERTVFLSGEIRKLKLALIEQHEKGGEENEESKIIKRKIKEFRAETNRLQAENEGMIQEHKNISGSDSMENDMLWKMKRPRVKN